jgi:hypothetical protein
MVAKVNSSKRKYSGQIEMPVSRFKGSQTKAMRNCHICTYYILSTYLSYRVICTEHYVPCSYALLLLSTGPHRKKTQGIGAINIVQKPSMLVAQPTPTAL